MTDRNVYLYWVGPEFSLVTLLRKLMHLHSKSGKGYTINLITNNNINEYIQTLPPYFYDLCPAHQADFVRVHVICDRGGIWLDSDTLVLSSLDSLFDYLEGDNNGFFIKENNAILWNGIFGSKKNTDLMIQWKKELIETLDIKKSTIDWSEVGCMMLQSLYNRNKSLYNNYKIFEGLNNLYPVNWNRCVNEFIDKPYDNYKTIIREYQPVITLVNSVYRRLASKTADEILESNYALNYFINMSIETAGYDIKGFNDITLIK